MQPVSAVLDRVLGELGLKPALEGWRAVEAWASVVGPRIAKRSRATSFREGVLHVEVEGSAWMQELGLLRREILHRLHEALGADTVRELRFSIARGRSPR